MELHLANNVSKLLVFLFKSLYGDNDSFFSSVRFFLRSFPMIFSGKWNRFRKISNTCDEPLLNQNPCNGQTFDGEERTCIDEEMSVIVMNRLGIVCGFDDINEHVSFGAQDLVSLFEEKEPSLDEIKETFKVFDVNNDGFIDATELHRVVCNLGLEERYELEECKKMIEAFDGNGDGLIDFQEFVTFMENVLVDD